MMKDDWLEGLPTVEDEKSPEEQWIDKHADPTRVSQYQLPQLLCFYFVDIEPFFSDSDLYEPEDWAWRKYIVRSASGWRCEDCGFDCREDRKNLHTDHVHGREPNVENEFRPHAFPNLRARCLSCHGQKHGFEIRDRRPVVGDPFD